MKLSIIAAASLAAAVAFGATGASAAGACITKSAEATSGSADSAKWFAIETMVQGISWSLWPGYVANSKVEGYTISNQQFKCTGTGSVTCRGNATFCKT
jgi:hypothetical protein